jgi:hypothetical protein
MMKAKLFNILRRAVCAALALMEVSATWRARTHRGSDGMTARSARRRGKGGWGQAHERYADGRAHRAARIERRALSATQAHGHRRNMISGRGV